MKSIGITLIFGKSEASHFKKVERFNMKIFICPMSRVKPVVI